MYVDMFRRSGINIFFYNEVDFHILLFASINENCFKTSFMATVRLVILLFFYDQMLLYSMNQD